MNKKLVGLLGLKGAGKDTCANFMVQELGYQRIGFADALYREVAQAYGVTVDFLGKRETKETPLPELALQACRETEFVECVAQELGLSAPTVELLRAPQSPRFVLQLWGTEYRRKRVADSYWLDQVKEKIEANPQQFYVITDVRFLNEFNFVGENGGLRIRIRRPALEEQEAAERERNGRAAHASEIELLSVVPDFEIVNKEGKPDYLRDAILDILGNL
jgi:hypothetical protein